MKEPQILFLDDDLTRTRVFWDEMGARSDFKFKWVETADQAIEQLSKQKWDIICLDHDLGGKVFQDSAKGTGYEVAEFLSKMNPKNDPAIYIHSWNPIGAENMRNILKGQAFYVPFGLDYVKFIISYAESLI